MIKLYECDTGFTIRGVNYDLEHVVDISYEDPERVRIARGANAKNKTGVSYREGLAEAKTITTNAIDIPLELYNLLNEIYDVEDRIEFYCISRKDGSSLFAKSAVLSQRPLQTSIAEGAESLQIPLAIESFDVKYTRKS